MGDLLVINWQTFGFILFSLFLLATGYAFFINKFFDQLQGYMSLMVVAGVLVTLAAAAFISWQAALIVGGCFCASGAPMVISDILRAINKRERVKDFQRAIVESSEEEIHRLITALDNDD